MTARLGRLLPLAPVWELCPACHGTRWEAPVPPDTYYRPCPVCKGRGIALPPREVR